MPVAWDATKASYLVPQLFSIQNVHHIGLLLITEGMHNGSKIVNGDRSLYLCSIKAHKSFFFRFNIRPQQCFHEAHDSVHCRMV